LQKSVLDSLHLTFLRFNFDITVCR